MRYPTSEEGNIKGLLLVVATCSHLYRRQTPYLKPFIVRRRWHPTPEEGNTKGLLLVITTAKDGALSGGPKFMRVSAGNCNSNPNAGWGFS